MSFEIKRANRTGVNPLIVPYSESGCGKTYSSLLLARGLAGPNGKIVVADSESRRASLYADVIPGGFETFDLCEPFSPSRYVEAVDALEQSGAAVGIIDSGSHEWEGPSGVLDLAGEAEHKSGKSGLHNWRIPKLEHAKFIQRLLRSKIPLIVCLRAKFKTKQGKDDRGKTCIVKDDYGSPIQAEDFIFEATAHFEILHDHSIRLTKCSHPSLKECFPTSGPITVQHGEAIARWCAAPGISPAARTMPPLESNMKALKRDLWTLTKPIHKGDKAKLEHYLLEQNIISDMEMMDHLTAVRLVEIIDALKGKVAA